MDSKVILLVEGEVVILLDVESALTEAGFEVVRTEDAEAVPTMPVICMSGDSAADWHAQRVPGSVVIQKPFVTDQIITALSTLLNRATVDKGNQCSTSL